MIVVKSSGAIPKASSFLMVETCLFQTSLATVSVFANIVILPYSNLHSRHVSANDSPLDIECIIIIIALGRVYYCHERSLAAKTRHHHNYPSCASHQVFFDIYTQILLKEDLCK